MDGELDLGAFVEDCKNVEIAFKANENEAGCKLTDVGDQILVSHQWVLLEFGYCKSHNVGGQQSGEQ